MKKTVKFLFQIGLTICLLMGIWYLIEQSTIKDDTNSEKEAVEHIYRQLRNAEPPDEQTARETINNLFFSAKLSIH